MEVILLERVGKLGQMGDVVRVKDGFARNFLLPRGKALRATADNKANFEGMKAELQARNLELKGDAGKLAATLDGKTIIVIRQASEAGQLFGSVSTRDIATLLNADGAEVNRTQVALNAPIKAIGQYKVPLALHPEVETADHRHRRAQRRTKPSASRAARTSPSAAQRGRGGSGRRARQRPKPSSSRKRPRPCARARSRKPTPRQRRPRPRKSRPKPPRRRKKTTRKRKPSARTDKTARRIRSSARRSMSGFGATADKREFWSGIVCRLMTRNGQAKPIF